VKSKKIPERLESKRLLLRKLNHTDAPGLYANIRDKEISRWLSGVPYPYPKDLALKFVLTAIAKFENKKRFTFGITIKGIKKEAVGVISLEKVDYKNKNAMLGYWIGKKYWGKGYMTEAVKELLSFGFETIGLHRIYANVYSENPASERILRKFGFIFEGVEREKFFKEGEWQDYLTYGLLKKEYSKAM
jgi:RimJ/RimL family protein N-acetyltransferase